MKTPSGPLALGGAGSTPRHQEHHANRARDSEGGPHSNKTISMLTARGETHSTENENLSAHDRESIGFERDARMQVEPTPKEHTNMKTNNERSAAAHSYANAHAIHCSERDYPLAVRSYDQLIALHPNAPEAAYARTQIRNIVNSVILAKELLAAELELVLRYLRPDADSPAAVSP